MPNDWKKFLEDKELRRKWAIENCQAMGFKKSEEEIEKMISDPVKLSRYERARKIMDRESKCRELVDKYIAEGAPKVHVSLRRIYAYMLDTSGTPEADKKNLAYIKEISTQEGAIKYLNKYVQTCVNFDKTKLYRENKDEALDLYENNFQEVQMMFEMHHMVTQGDQTFNPELTDFFKSSMGIIQDANRIRTEVATFASNYSLTLPSEDIEGRDKAMVIGTLLLKLDKLSKERLKNNEPGTEPVPGQESAEHFLQLYGSQMMEEYIMEGSEFIDANYKKLIDKGILTKDFIKDYKAFDKTGKQVPLFEAIKSNKMEDDYLFVKYNQTEKSKIDRLMEKAVVPTFLEKKIDNENILKVLNHVEVDKVDKAQGTRSYNRINAIKDTIKQLYNVGNKPKEVPIMSSSAKGLAAASLIKALEEKHNSRTGVWRFFHPFQKKAEFNAIQECKNMVKQYGVYTDDTFDKLYDTAQTYDRDENGNYYYEKDQEAIKYTESELLQKNYHDRFGETTNEVISEEDFAKQLDDTFSPSNEIGAEIKSPQVVESPNINMEKGQQISVNE